jgi:hypothetical protein
MSWVSVSLAAFQVTISGRFWVTPEAGVALFSVPKLLRDGTLADPATAVCSIPNSLTVRARYADGVQVVMNNDAKGVRFKGDKGWLQLIAANVERVEPKSVLEGLTVPGGHWKELSPHAP